MDTSDWEEGHFRAARDHVDAMSHADILERLAELPEAKLREMVRQHSPLVAYVAGQKFVDQMNNKIRRRLRGGTPIDKQRFLDKAHPVFETIADNMEDYFWKSVRTIELADNKTRQIVSTKAKIYLGEAMVADVFLSDAGTTPMDFHYHLNVPAGVPTRVQWVDAIESFMRDCLSEEPPRKRQRTE